MKKKILKGFFIFLALLVLQSLTFFLFAEKQLKGKLMHETFVTLKHHSDSIFVRDVMISECGVGIEDYKSHHLEDDESLIKEKWKVKHVKFFSFDDTTLLNYLDTNYKVSYATWYQRRDLSPLLVSFCVTQQEELLIDNDLSYQVEKKYIWFFFCWIQTFEFWKRC